MKDQYKQNIILSNAQRIIKKVRETVTAVLLVILTITSSLGFAQTIMPEVAEAAIPKLINFQGKLTNVSNGTNVPNGNYTFEFKLYTAPTGGSLLWTETWDGSPSPQCDQLPVVNGVFNAKLGQCNSLAGVDFSSGALYLSVNFDDGGGFDGEMSPRKQLVSSAFAFVANSVSGDGTIDITNTSTNQVSVNYDGSNKLQVGVASNGLTTFTSTGSGSGYNFVGGNLSVGSNDLQNSWLRIGQNGSNQSEIQTLNVGAGSTNLHLSLGIQGGGNPTGSLFVKPVNGGAFHVQDPGTGTNRFTVLQTGNVGVGDDTPASLFTVGSGDLFQVNSSGAIAAATGVTSSGTITLSGLGGSGTRCLQVNNSGVLSVAGAGCLGSMTPWTTDIDADGYDLQDLSNIEFRDTTGAPAGSVVAIFRDNAGDLNINSLTGKTTNIQVNGTDEYNFSSTELNVNSNNITGVSVLTMVGGQASDITTPSNTTATALIMQPGTSSGASSNGAATTVRGGNGSGTTTVVGGALALQGGNATGGSGTRTGGAVNIDGGTGATANGAVNIGSTVASAINIGTVATAKTITIGSTAGDTIAIGSGATTAKTITIGSGAVANTITIGSASATNVSITDNNWSVTTAGVATFVGVNSGSGLIQGTGGLTLTGTTSINNNTNSATNINTGTSNALVTIGGGSGTFSLQTSNIDISNTGAITNATGFNGLIVTANTGVITTGTWNGTLIGAQYGGTGLNTSASTGIPTISSGTWSVTSSLGVALGGTGATTLTSNGVLYGNGTSAIQATAQGGANTVLVANGGAPSFSAAITVGTSVTSPSIVGSTSVTTPLLNSSGAIAITPAAGSGLSVNLSTTGDFAVNTNQLYVDTSAGNVGIGTTAPSHALEIVSGSPGSGIKLQNNLVNLNAKTSTIVQGHYNNSEEPISLISGLSLSSLSAVLIGGGNSGQNAATYLSFYTAADNITQAGTERMRIISNGNVGIGDTTPASLFTVGNGDLFQINSSGAIATAAGITSSGTITFSGLGTNSAVYTNGSSELTTTAPTSGSLGFWNRTGTILSPATSGDTLSVPGAGANSERFGAGSLAGGNLSIAIGNANSSGAGDISIGNAAGASGNYGVAVGYNAKTTGSQGISIGLNTTGTGIVLGGSASGAGISIGISASSTQGSGLAIGQSSQATGAASTALGYLAVSTHDYSIALGRATTTGHNQFVSGASAGPINNVYFGKGVVNSSPTSYTINGTGGDGTNIAGASIAIAGGRGTGNAAGGNILFQTSNPGSSGTTLQTLSTKMDISAAGDITAYADGRGFYVGGGSGYMIKPIGSGLEIGAPGHGILFTPNGQSDFRGVLRFSADYSAGINFAASGNDWTTLQQVANYVGFYNNLPGATIMMRGHASQSANLFELQNSSGTALSLFNSAGALKTSNGNLGVARSDQGTDVNAATMFAYMGYNSSNYVYFSDAVGGGGNNLSIQAPSFRSSIHGATAINMNQQDIEYTAVNINDGASQAFHVFDVNTATVTGANARLLAVENNGTEVFGINKDGAIQSDVLISGGTQCLQANASGFISGTGSACGAGGGGMSIGGSITSATTGSVLFAGAAGVLQQDNANFFWDDTNNRLGIGTSSPIAPLHVTGSGNFGTHSLLGNNIATGAIFNPTYATDLSMGSAGSVSELVMSNSSLASPATFAGSVNHLKVTGSATLPSGTNLFGARNIVNQNGTGSIPYAVGSSNFVNRTAAGSITIAVGGEFGFNNSIGSGSTPVAAGIAINRPVSTAGHTIGSTFGMYIYDQTNTAGTQTNTPYGIFQEAASNNNYFAGNVGIGGASSPGAKLHVATNTTSGAGTIFNVTQTQPNATDTGDSALNLTYTLQASSGTNQAVVRGLGFNVVNQLTGGGALQSMRAFNLALNSLSGTTINQADYIYLEPGTSSGSVGATRGIAITNLYGDRRAGISVTEQSGGSIANINLLLGSYSIPAGDYSIYSASAKQSYFAGNVGIGDATPASLFTVGSGDLFQVNSSGAIAAATGITSSGTITFSGLGGGGTQCVQVNNSGVISGTGSACGAGGGGMSIGGSITSATTGSILFAGAAGVLQQDNANFFWDDANDRLGIGTATPSSKLDVVLNSTSTGSIFGQSTNVSWNPSGAAGLANASQSIMATTGTQNVAVINGHYIEVSKGNSGAGNVNGSNVYIDQNGTSGYVSSYASYQTLSGNVTTSNGLFHALENYGTINDSFGAYIGDYSNSGTITNNYGVAIRDYSVGTNNIGIAIGEATGTKNTNLLIGTTTQPNGSYSIYNSSSDDNYFAGRLGLGVTTPLSKLHVVGSVTTSGSNAVAGTLSDLTLTNSTASGFQFGNRMLNTINGGTAGTHVGQFIRMTDSTSLSTGQIVRGLEIQAYSGTNNNGINTGIQTYGKTFGINAVTTAQAGAVSQPAAVFADLDNGSNTTVGNAIRAYTDNATSADLVSFYQETSSFSGNGLVMSFGNNSGSFSGNFISLNRGGTQYAHINANGNAFFSLRNSGTEAVCHVGNDAVNDAELTSCDNTPVADYAEMYPVDAGIDVWEIVSVGSEMVNTYDTNSNGLIDWNKVKGQITRLKKSTTSYQKNIIGIVSDNYNDFSSTGYNIKQQDNPKSVALKGRVPVKVTNENGVIKAGDYITSSATMPGYGMKATRSGQIVGQALADFGSSTGNETGQVMVFVQIGFQSIGNTIVLDAPTSQGMNIQGDESGLANTASTFTIQQQASEDEEVTANILQLQTGDANRFMVSSTGATSILSNLSCEADSAECPSVLKVTQANTELMNIDARGTLTLAGTIIIKDDTFAGSVATDADGLAEITFSYHLGTGKPVVQLTAEAQIPVFAQILEFKQDSNGNYTGFVMKTFDLISGSVQAIVHYNVVGKQSGYITLGAVVDEPLYSGFNSGDGGEYFGGDGVGLIIEGGEVVGTNGSEQVGATGEDEGEVAGNTTP